MYENRQQRLNCNESATEETGELAAKSPSVFGRTRYLGKHRRLTILLFVTVGFKPHRGHRIALSLRLIATFA